MNFLAHTLLGFDDDALVAGQVAGDFVRGTRLDALPPRIALGVRMHRSIDAWTDGHEAFGDLRARFAPELRRFAGIAIDVGIDHVIARDWRSWEGAPHGAVLGAHAERVGAALARYRTSLPSATNRFAPHLVRTLPGWATRRGVADTLERLSRRSPRMRPLAATPGELRRLDDHLEALVRAMWPDALARARAMLTAPVAARPEER